MSGRLLVIAAGGTGGHMFPAQALAEAMLARGWRVALSTDARGARYAAGFPAAVERRALASATLARGGLAAKAAAPLAIGAGIGQAIAWFQRARPACVAGFGGYPAIPALSAAWALRLPRLIHEQNGVLGRVNRRFAARVDALACGTWPLANAPKGAAPVHVGNPVRRAALEAGEAPYAPPGRGDLGLVAFGGSQGASVFADLLPAAVAALPEALRARLRVTQQARAGEAERVAGAYRAAGIAAEVAPFFDDMPRRIAAAQLVVSRAGASTCAELAAIGRPSILTPYPAATDDHQTANARALSEAGAAILAPQSELTEAGLTGHLAAVLGDPARAGAMAAAARALGRPEAASDLADLVERVADRRGDPR